MLKKILDRFSSRANPVKSRRTRAAKLLDYLEEHASLTLDKEGLAAIGMNRKQAFQTVYDLVLHDSIQMRAEPDGRVVAMSNAEYNRQMEVRAKKLWKDEAGLVLDGDRGAFDLAFADSDSFAGPDGGDECPEFLSLDRQTLPERARDPWIGYENLAFDDD